MKAESPDEAGLIGSGAQAMDLMPTHARMQPTNLQDCLRTKQMKIRSSYFGMKAIQMESHQEIIISRSKRRPGPTCSERKTLEASRKLG